MVSKSVAAAEDSRAGGSSQTAEYNEGNQGENYGTYHYECKPFRGSHEIEEGLHLRSGVAGGGLLNFFQHFGAELSLFVKQKNGQRLEDRGHAKKQQAAESADFGSERGSYRPSGKAMAGQSDSQPSGAERRYKRIQAEK